MKSSTKIFDKLIIFYILLQPFIDAITMYQIRYPIKIPTVSVIFRGLFFLIVIIWLYKKNNRKHLIFLLLGYFIIDSIYIIFFSYNSLYQEIANLFQIFYLPIVLYFFMNYENKFINDNFIFKVYLIYLNLIVIPYFLGIGVYASDYYVGKSGYYGLFNGGNEISAIILGLMPIVIKHLLEHKNYLLRIITIIESLFCIYLIGTKTILLGSIIVIGYFITKWLLKSYKKINKKQMCGLLLIFIFIILIGYTILPMTPLYKNVYLALKFFNVNSIYDFTNIDVIDSIIFSGRLNILGSINDIYLNSNLFTIIFGLGESTLLNLKLIEIDIFDIFYSIGILGFLIYLFVTILILKKIKIKSVYKFSFILLVFVSLFTGHILTSTCVSIYFGILVLLSKNSNNQFKICFICQDGNNYFNFSKNYLIIKKKYKNNWFYNIKIICNILLNNYDVIVCDSNKLLCKFNKKIIKVSSNCLIINNKNFSLDKLEYIDYLITTNDTIKKKLINKYNFLDSKILVCNNEKTLIKELQTIKNKYYN